MIRGKWTALATMLALTGCNDTVVDVTPVSLITIDAVSPAPLPGGTVQLRARAVGPDRKPLEGRTFTFLGGNDTVATVSTTGLLTSIGPGKVTVTAWAEGKSGNREITVNYPVPTVTSITPNSVPSFGAAAITVRGTGFFPRTFVRVNGVHWETTHISSVELRINFTAADVATASTVAISVVNPTPGGGPSESLSLSVLPGNLCTAFAPLTLGTTISGALDPTDCNNGTASAPSFQDYYNFTTTGQTAVTLTLTSTAFDPFLSVTDATNSLALYAFGSAKRPNPVAVRLLLPGRTFAVVPGTANSGAVGAYTLASTTSAVPTITNCEGWVVVPPMNLAQTVATSDCAYTDPGKGTSYWDDYAIFVRAGQTVTFTLESAVFKGFLYMFTGDVELYEETSASGIAQILFTPTVQGVYYISAGPVNLNVTGAYTLRIQ